MTALFVFDLLFMYYYYCYFIYVEILKLWTHTGILTLWNVKLFRIVWNYDILIFLFLSVWPYFVVLKCKLFFVCWILKFGNSEMMILFCLRKTNWHNALLMQTWPLNMCLCFVCVVCVFLHVSFLSSRCLLVCFTMFLCLNYWNFEIPISLFNNILIWYFLYWN